MASSSSSHNWVYDVFPSFSGKDVRVTFLSHFLKELDRKLIIAFKDNKMERSRSLDPELKQAIKDSRIAVVVFSKIYASSSWCLNELLEIVKCKEEFGQMVIPVFHGLNPSHVRKQTGDFGKIFEETCKNKTKEVKNQWIKALTSVANILGYHYATRDSEAKMIEEIVNDILGKLLSTSSKDFEDFVGIKDHIENMSVLLQLESKEVKMVGIWGSSGIGKTTIARALFNQISRHFQGSIFIDRSFVSKIKEIYSRANPDDHNMKLHLQEQFLSEIMGIKDIKIDHLGALRDRVKHQKLLIVIDDLDDLTVLKVLADEIQWFGSGSRIIVVTNDKHLLRAHMIDHIYEVGLPTEKCACEMLCQYAFSKKIPLRGFEELVVEVTRHAGSLPLGLNVLGSYLRGRDQEYWKDMLPRLQNGLDDKIEKILRVSYDELGREEDQVIFRHIACLFNHMKVTSIKSFLADRSLGVNIALQNLADKSLIHVRKGHVEMHCLLQEMGRKIVRTQSIDKPGKQEFLVDSKDICDVLSEGIGTQKVLGISLNASQIDELHVHESAFKRMRNLRFLQIYSKIYTQKDEEVRLHLPESFDYLPPKLKLLCWPKYPMSCMPSNFRPENLVMLKMRESKLEKLWEGVVSLTCLKEIDLARSDNLKEIPDLSKATNLVKLDLDHCWSLVALPSSIKNLHKLTILNMGYCNSMATLPTGFNLKSLDYLNLEECFQLRTFPKFSTNISVLNLYGTNIEEFPSNLHLQNLVELVISKDESDGKQWEGVEPLTSFMAMLSPTLTELELEYMPSLVELPSSFQNLNQLERLSIRSCENLETLPTGINLKSLHNLDFHGCSRLRSFPKISTNISYLNLNQTGIEEVPWWINNFYKLIMLTMEGCNELKCVSLNISKLKHLKEVHFSDCGALTRVDLSGCPSGVEMETDSIATVPEDVSSSILDDYVPEAKLYFTKCFKLDQDALIQQQPFIIFNSMVFPGEEVPSYFTHRTTETSLTNIPLLHIPLPQQVFRFRACAVVTASNGVCIDVNCQFKGRFGYTDDSNIVRVHSRLKTGKDSHLLIFECGIKVNALLNYDYVDMKIGLSDWESTFELKGWGIRLSEDCSSLENLLRPWHEENILYSSRPTTATSLTNITLPHTCPFQTLLRVKVFATYDSYPDGQLSCFVMHVSCLFRGRFGNHFVSPYRPQQFYKIKNGVHFDIFECSFPLNQGDASLAQLNYDHVDIHFQLTNLSKSTGRLLECSIDFLEDCSSPENRSGTPNTFHDVSEAYEDNTVSDGCYETKYSEEREESDDSENDQFEECGDSDIGSEIDQYEDCGDNDLGSETDEFEECGDSD
ncbi:Protein VARIATION IN COMPOUND TRIGGERED ROOT growth response [Cardamine amara subsp. amara]|uniref:ADP-ribosyl cyclase/cyclic ADP-ribose hydrolase n=1 Tax=Cardamine amara subsp. amara TaxID=228776 RepID=A0ABD1C9L2_CARAN